VVAIGDCADRMAEDLDRGFGNVLIVIRRTRLAKIFQLPRLVFASLNVDPWLDAGKATEFLKSSIGACSSAEEHGMVGTRALRHDALDVGVKGRFKTSHRLRPGDNTSVQLPFDLVQSR